MVEVGIPVLVLVVWLIAPWWISRWWRERRGKMEAARFWEEEAAVLERELKVVALGHRVVDERLRRRLAAFEQQRPQRFVQALADAGIAGPEVVLGEGRGERAAS